MSEPLKPCPFCGGTDVRAYPSFNAEGKEVSYRQCHGCTAMGPDEHDGRGWNTRAALAASEARPVMWQERQVLDQTGRWSNWYACADRTLDAPRERREANGMHFQWRPLFAAPPQPAEPSGWVACSERMPKDGEHVALDIAYQFSDHPFPRFIHRMNGRWIGPSDTRRWMPLPQPPEDTR